MLNLSGVTKTLPGGRTLFADLMLAVAAGECVAIVGESGAGKSTLLNLVAGLDHPDRGRIVVDEEDIASLDEDARTLFRRRHMGFIFQAFHLLPHLSLAQNVALPLLLLKESRAAAMARAADGLARVGLGMRGDDFPRQISGGEMQRVAIARALVHRPRLLLADEPTGNLDPENAARVLELMATLVREHGTAMLLVTHSEATAAVAHRRMRLSRDGLLRE